MTAFLDLADRMDGQSPLPLYQQLQSALRDAIQEGALKVNDRLPAERELAAQFSISRVTIRKALEGLINEGVLLRRQGSGTFVNSRVEKSFSKLSSFTEDMIARGRSPDSQWLGKSTGTVTPEESLLLGLSPGSSVYRFNRLRFADDLSMALEFSTVPAFCLPAADSVEISLYSALELTGYRPTRALQRLRAVSFTKEQSELLDVEPGAAGLLIERRGFLADGRAVELTRSHYRGDAYDFIAELSS